MTPAKRKTIELHLRALQAAMIERRHIAAHDALTAFFDATRGLDLDAVTLPAPLPPVERRVS